MKYDILFLTDEMSNIVPTFVRGYHIIINQKVLSVNQPLGLFSFDIDNLEKLGIVNVIKKEN